MTPRESIENTNRPKNQNSKPMRLILGSVLIAAIVLCVVFVVTKRRSNQAPAVVATPEVIPQETNVASKTVVSEKPVEVAPIVKASSSILAKPTLKPLTAREMLAELQQLGQHGPITAQQAERFKQILAALIAQGDASVPAIREYLQKSVDIDFGQAEGGDQLSYSSLRASLFDTLKQIGGPEAQALLAETLATTALPTELLDLAQDLEQLAPGQYRSEILQAAHEALEMANSGQLGTNAEVGPAYRILNAYGTADMADQPNNEIKLKISEALEIANQPDGKGLSSLLEIAEKPSADPSGKSIATQVIAQLAGRNDQAFDALLSMAEKGEIAQNLWVKLAPILGGEEYQIGNGSDGKLSLANNANNANEISQRITMIDKFLGVVEQDSAAASALKRQRGVLLLKLTGS